MNVEILNYKKLKEVYPNVEEEYVLSDNGSGKEYANYLVITAKGGRLCGVFSDAMEAEDARFTRDLSWIKDALTKAYLGGLTDAIYDDEVK